MDENEVLVVFGFLVVLVCLISFLPLFFFENCSFFIFLVLFFFFSSSPFSLCILGDLMRLITKFDVDSTAMLCGFQLSFRSSHWCTEVNLSLYDPIHHTSCIGSPKWPKTKGKPLKPPTVLVSPTSLQKITSKPIPSSNLCPLAATCPWILRTVEKT